MKNQNQNDKDKNSVKNQNQNDKDKNSVKNQNKRSIHVVGDSMLNMIQENYNVNTKSAIAKVHAFSGATIEDLHDYILPIAREEPDNLIIHAGTNNIRNDTPEEIVEKLMMLHDHVSSIASGSKIALSNIIRRHDFKGERLKDKIINTNTLLALECKKRKIDLIDNISGKKGSSPKQPWKETDSSKYFEVFEEYLKT